MTSAAWDAVIADVEEKEKHEAPIQDLVLSDMRALRDSPNYAPGATEVPLLDVNDPLMCAYGSALDLALRLHVADGASANVGTLYDMAVAMVFGLRLELYLRDGDRGHRA